MRGAAPLIFSGPGGVEGAARGAKSMFMSDPPLAGTP